MKRKIFRSDRWELWEEDELLNANPHGTAEYQAIADKLGRSLCSVRTRHSLLRKEIKTYAEKGLPIPAKWLG